MIIWKSKLTFNRLIFENEAMLIDSSLAIFRRLNKSLRVPIIETDPTDYSLLARVQRHLTAEEARAKRAAEVERIYQREAKKLMQLSLTINPDVLDIYNAIRHHEKNSLDTLDARLYLSYREKFYEWVRLTIRQALPQRVPIMASDNAYSTVNPSTSAPEFLTGLSPSSSLPQEVSKVTLQEAADCDGFVNIMPEEVPAATITVPTLLENDGDDYEMVDSPTSSPRMRR